MPGALALLLLASPLVYGVVTEAPAGFDNLTNGHTTQAPVGPDIEAFARFMRSTKVPPRDFTGDSASDIAAGQNIFNSIGCAHCHTPTIQTAPPGPG